MHPIEQSLNDQAALPAPNQPRWRAWLRPVGAAHAEARWWRSGLLLELGIIVLWSLMVTAPYLTLNPLVMPSGREFLHHIHPHYTWTHLVECGSCAWWNGNVRAGYPAFADPQSSLLHPLIILTTLAAGVFNGAKLALIGAFLLAGLAQWWLGRVLGLGPVARVWTACMAVAGSHLAGRLADGALGLVVSLAACALVLPPLIRLCQTGNRRSAVLLGVVVGLAMLAGQGYIQIGLLLTLPAVLVLLPWERAHLWRVGRGFVLAGGLALLIAAPFLLPFALFASEFGKFGDPYLDSTQPLKYIPLNLVIDDLAFLTTDLLDKQPFPAIYANYIGWVPVLLAVAGLLELRTDQQRRTVWYLAGAVLLAFWAASGTPQRWLVALLPAWQETVNLVRFPPLFAPLAVPPLLGLAGLGLQRLLALPWPRVQFVTHARADDKADQPTHGGFNIRWLMVLPLGLALLSALTFGRNWIATTEIDPAIFEVLDQMQTNDLQWVETPIGEQFWIGPAISRNLKVSSGTQGWFWYGRNVPSPFYIAVKDDEEMPEEEAQVQVGELTVFRTQPGTSEYAAAELVNGTRAVCTAFGTGGHIDVRCELATQGVLTLQENSWTGWAAYRDIQRVPLLDGPRLSVLLPPGVHLIRFRYEPWDVTLGLALAGLGLTLAGLLLWRGDPPRTTPVFPPDEQTDETRHA